MNLIERVKANIETMAADVGLYAGWYRRDCAELLRLVRETNDNLTSVQTRCTELLQTMRAQATPRDTRQKTVARWVYSAFGAVALSRKERVLRFLEEAIELAQAEGLSAVEVDRVTTHVYGKPVGSPAQAVGSLAQEVGGVAVTLLAYCHVADISADVAECEEMARVFAIDADVLRTRQKVKADAGIVEG